MVNFMKFFLFFPLCILATEGFPKKIILFEAGCEKETTCRTNFQGKEKDFVLRWRNYEEGSEHFLAMDIEGKAFHVPISPHLMKSDPFPLRLYVFSDTLKLYGSLYNEGTGGVYINYFSRDENGFHYLALSPFLSYDASSSHFIGGENVGPGEYITYYYRLEGNSFALERTENSLDQE